MPLEKRRVYQISNYAKLRNRTGPRAFPVDVALFCSVRARLEPVVLGEPPYHDTGYGSKDDREKDDESADNGAFAFAAFAVEP